MITLAFAAALAAPPVPTGPDGTPPTHGIACDRAPIGKDSFCTASDGTRLHFVDWGGEGPVIVLVTGLGNSARIFDELGPLLAQGHRVIAITRRGYGLSDDARSGNYGNARLVRDVLDILDGLDIEKAAFVGHSLAGGELSTLGREYPHRVTRLVYLDAAYDRSPVPSIMADLPAMPPPSAKDLASLKAMTKWREGALRVVSEAVEADLEDVMTISSQGLRPRTSPEIAQAILAGDIAAPPDYSEIEAPSLAIYTSKDVAEQVPASADPEVKQNIVAYSTKRIRPWMLRAQATFLEEQACGAAYEVPHSGHYMFLERPEWTARTILAFLDTPSPCSFAVVVPAIKSAS